MPFMIQAGSKEDGSDTVPDQWTLGGGSGPRSYKVHIEFSQRFPQVPTVLVMLSGFESHTYIFPFGIPPMGAAARSGIPDFNIWVGTEDVTDSGFTLIYSTWGETAINSITLTWIAFTL